MKRPIGILAVLVLLLMGISVQPAQAAESIPELQWPAVDISPYEYPMTTSPQGDITLACGTYGGSYGIPQDLVTYGLTGTIGRYIDRTSQIDGVNNCIERPVVDKNGTLYGVPADGPNLLAYDGNTLKWKYPLNCPSNLGAWPVIGADGNIYVINNDNRLVGLTPEVEPGQTQPTKILDIPVVGRCGNELRAYKDGIVVIWSYGEHLNYYSYGGKDLGEPAGNYDGDYHFPLNADGRLFYSALVQGSYLSLSISAYDPTTDRAAWTTMASTSGANIQYYQTYPVSDGGVMVAVREQKMVGGAPAVPEEYVTTLVKLSSNGQRSWSRVLPFNYYKIWATAT